MTVKMEGRSYTDLLREMREKVLKEEVGEVLSVQKLGDKDVLQIRVKAGPSSSILKNVISSRVEGAVVQQSGAQSGPKVFHIKDLEWDSTEDVVRKGVAHAIQVPEPEVKVTSLRPAFGNMQNATVVLQGEMAAKLQEVQRIKIGWVSCRVVLREKVNRCYHCWEMGHTARSYMGVDRSQQYSIVERRATRRLIVSHYQNAGVVVRRATGQALLNAPNGVKNSTSKCKAQPTCDG